jgi:exosortase B
MQSPLPSQPSATLVKKSLLDDLSQLLKTCWPIVIGLLVMYVPTFLHLSETVWNSDNQAHGPLILMIVLYLFWTKKDAPIKAGTKNQAMLGWLIFFFGLVLYAVGRSQEIIVLDVGSIIFVLIGIILIKSGASALKTFWFPLFFLIFMIPLPGSMLDAVTLPMKVAVSYVASNVLYWLDYPVARTGVIIQISQYKLLVADACAGMHTLISLEALGLLYLNIVKHDSFARNLVLALLIIPISFTANVIRVMVLILVTYYFGDAAGQGFIHGFAGMLLFTVALILIMFVDSAIQYLINKRSKAVGGGTV